MSQYETLKDTAAPHSENVKVPEMTDGILALARFGAKCLKEFREDVGDLDGGDLQEWATDTGCLEKREVFEPCGEQCVCEEYHGESGMEDGVDCYFTPDAVSEILKGGIVEGRTGTFDTASKVVVDREEMERAAAGLVLLRKNAEAEYEFALGLLSDLFNRWLSTPHREKPK